MKKLLGSTLALAMFLPAGANAELLKNLKVSGSLEVQATSANNVSDLNTSKYDQIGDVQTRLLLNTDWDLLDDVHSKLTIRKNNRTYGSASESVGTAVVTNFIFDQANVKIDKLFGFADATLGRQFYGDVNDAVIHYGPKGNQYGLTVTALDAFRFDWNGEAVGVTGIAGKIASGGTVGAGDEVANTDLRGLRVNLKGNESYNGAVYAYNRVTHNSTAGIYPYGNDYLYVVGLKGKFSAGGAWIKGEFDKNFGQYRPTGTSAVSNYTGWAVLAEAGYKADVSGVGVFTPWGSFAMGSGGASANRNYTQITASYRPSNIYGFFAPSTAGAQLGSAGTLGAVGSGSLGNRVIWSAGFKATPASLNKLTAGVSFYDFRYQNVLGAPAAALGNKHIGSEGDLNVAWAHSENVSFDVALGSFQPGGAIMNAQSAHNPTTMARATATVKF